MSSSSETSRLALTAGLVAALAGVSALLITQDYCEPTDHPGADFDDLEGRIHRPPSR